MDIPALRIFVAAAREGSFTRAAERLHAAQSNVSTAIAHLEREVNGALFIRNKNGVTLTVRGAELLTIATQIMELAEQAAASGQTDQPPRGILSLSAMESTAVVRLAPLFPRFLKRFPGVHIQLKTGDSSIQRDLLLRQAVDCAFLSEAMGDPGFEERILFREEMMLAFPSHLKATRIEQLAPADFLVLPRGCSYRKRLHEIITVRQMTGVTLHEVQGIHSLFACVAAGMGAGLFPKSFLIHHEAQRRGISVLPLPRNQRYLEVRMVWRKRGFHGSVLREWNHFVQGAVKPP